MKTYSKTKLILSLGAVLLSTLTVTNISMAGGWKDLKNSLKSEKNKAKNEAKNEAKKELNKELSKDRKSNSSSNSSNNKSTSNSSSRGSSKPNPELRSSILKCDDVPLTNVQIGNSTSYKVTEGISSSDYTGFINRRKAQVSNTCFVGVLQSDECVTMEVSKAVLDKASGGTSNNLKMQCVYSDNPSKMATAEVPYKADNVALSYMLLKCGHEQGDDYPCDEGSNSTRAGKYKDQYLSGKVQLSVCGTTYHQVPQEGQHIYCQYYNKKSKKSIFGFEFNQTRN